MQAKDFRPWARNFIRLLLGFFGGTAIADTIAGNPEMMELAITGVVYVLNELWWRWDQKFGGAT
jgi:hypothetical protein